MLSDQDNESHISQIQEEMKKSRPNMEHINLLLKETYLNRRNWLTKQPAGSWAPLMETYPCFQNIEQVHSFN